ncbi:cytochrome b [Kushneria marisflavi]|nr:cytochrome b [Kushneria marisflavi]RKD83881.1 cytochrome b561 [Kushneria marisflavi]
MVNAATMQQNLPDRWHSASRVLHWSSAALIAGLFASGWWMTGLSYYDSWYHRAPWWHKSFGLTLTALLILRIAARLAFARPPALGHRHARRAAHVGHLLLYLLLCAVLVAGYLISTAEGRGVSVFGLFEFPALVAPFRDQATLAGTMHWYAAWSLIVAGIGHALLALKHHFIDRDATLTRMLGRRA